MKYINKGKAQIIATCFFCKSTGDVVYENYSKYYQAKGK